MIEINFTLNGAPTTVEAQVHDSALAVLRAQGLASVRFGSDTGETGASAVLIDGRLTSTDNILAAQLGATTWSPSSR